eukprot:gene4089-4336_t
MDIQLEQQYGAHFRDRDVRLYLNRRQLNQQKPRRRAGFPLDDSFDRPGTFLKFIIERCTALRDVIPQLPPSAVWQLYTAIPGLLTYQTSTVAQRLHGLSYATDWRMQQLVTELCCFRRLAFLHPNAVEVRVGMLARLTRLDRGATVRLLRQQPGLWLISSRLLAER